MSARTLKGWHHLIIPVMELIRFYTTERRHQRLDRQTLDNVYYEAPARKVI
ncbi:hypothetical protein [Thiolapillus sp.]|uniref:hypothetical protein n=1 Tax=Thiolapillus sp. TaxID=2017437 RepID=UPI003AF9FA41